MNQSAAKRYRTSLLLDAYGALLTDRQRRFLRDYYERDCSFGEIAEANGVSRQAIFDAVRHGEEALEQFEQVLGLVAAGWLEWTGERLAPATVASRLSRVCDDLRTHADAEGALRELDRLVRELGCATLDATPNIPMEETQS